MILQQKLGTTARILFSQFDAKQLNHRVMFMSIRKGIYSSVIVLFFYLEEVDLVWWLHKNLFPCCLIYETFWTCWNFLFLYHKRFLTLKICIVWFEEILRLNKWLIGMLPKSRFDKNLKETSWWFILKEFLPSLFFYLNFKTFKITLNCSAVRQQCSIQPIQ